MRVERMPLKNESGKLYEPSVSEPLIINGIPVVVSDLLSYL